MTQNTTRADTILVNLLRENTHRNCPTKLVKEKTNWSLYCDNPRCPKTGNWIKFIPRRQAENILQR